MCSLYSINNSSKFAGQTSFQVVLCAKDNYHLALTSPGCASSPSISSSISPSSCPQYTASSTRRNSGKRARMKSKEATPVLLLSPPSTSHSSPPEKPSCATYTRIHSHSSQHQGSWRSNNQQARRKQQSIINQDHWLQFHQHQHSQDYGTRDSSNRTPSCSPPPTPRTYSHPHSERKPPPPRAFTVQQPLAWSSLFPSSSSTSSRSPSLSTLSPGNSGCVPVHTSFHPSPTPTSPGYSSVLQSNRPQIPAEMVIAMSSTTSKMDTDLSPVSAPSGSESNDNDAFDGDEMMLLPPPGTSLAPSSGTVSVPDNPDAKTLVSNSKPLPPPMEDDTVAMDRRSKRKRTIQRLQAKNRTLKLSLAQAKADLAAERQQRAVIDQIYLKIKQDLNQKLETEEIKNANLKADLEQITQDMKELKDQTSPLGIGSYFSSSLSSRSALGGVGSGSSGYKIGYDSSAYCAPLSGGFSSVGGMLHSSNMALISGQDDSEEFLSSHAYSPSTTRSRSLSSSTSSLLQTVKESEDEDEDMFTEDESDAVILSNSRSQSSLPTLMETDGEEETEDDDYDESSDDEAEYSEDDADNEDAPRTMMEILLQRQSSHSPDDDVQDQPADANETYESMAQKCLRHAVRSRFTAAQTHLQLDELIIKYNPRPEQTMAAISHELVRWWETERISTGGPAAIGGIFGNGPVAMKETGEQVMPKVAVETRFQRFFAPLLLHYVASHTEQKTLLDILGHEVQTQGQQDAKLLRNHNGQLMALYKFDVVEAEAIVEWWQSLVLPANVFGPGDNLRSLNSRFVAWLEDEEDDSDDEEDTENDSDYVDDDSDSEEDTDVASSEEDEVDEVTFNAQIQQEALDLQKDLALVDHAEQELMDKGCEQIVPGGVPVQSTQAGNESAPDPQQYLQDRKRRISFCASNVYYSQKGRMRTGPACFPGGDDITEDGNGIVNVSGPSATSRPRKTYQQCPPFVPQLSDEEDEVEDESDESTEGSGSSDGLKLVA